jgi:exonuclease VII small subunit
MDDLAMAKSKCNISPNTFSNATPENMMVTFDNAIVPCQKALDNLKDVKNTVIAKYARDVSSQIRDFRIALNAMVDAYKAKDAAKYTAAKTELIAIGTKLDTSETALQENLKKDVEGVKVKTELQKLRDIVDQKANK